MRVFGFEGLFDAYSTGEDVRRGKPDPEVFLIAARRLGVPPERCVVLEDAPAGIEAARAAGMGSIGVTNGVSRPGLAIADRVVDDLRSLSVEGVTALVPALRR